MAGDAPAKVGGASEAADRPVEVLFVLHHKFDLLDFAGPCDVFARALHDPKDPNSRAFEITFCGAEDEVLSSQGVVMSSQIKFAEAHANLDNYDILVVLGGNSEETLKASGATTVKEGVEPFALIQAYAAMQEKDPSRERTLMSVCTGSLFLARAGVLAGLSCTTHPDSITKLEILCSQATKRDLDEPPNVTEFERYVVNNCRFDVAEGEGEDPYVRHKSDTGRRASAPRKGSISFRYSRAVQATKRREEMRLGGLRVITSAGVTAGIDSALYLVGSLVSIESAQIVARALDHDWKKGVVKDGVDV